MSSAATATTLPVQPNRRTITAQAPRRHGTRSPGHLISSSGAACSRCMPDRGLMTPHPSRCPLRARLSCSGLPRRPPSMRSSGRRTRSLPPVRDDKDPVAQVEAAYDMLLMRSLNQRQAGKVASSSIRYADVNPVGTSGIGSMPHWLQSELKNSPVTIESPSTHDLGLQAGVYGALIVLTYINGASMPSSMPYAGVDVHGLILAGSFCASLYFMTKKNVKLGKATIITIGGLVAGAVVGSAVESWLQVDIVPFLGLHSPAALVL